MTELKLQQCRLDNRYDILECLGRGSYAEIFLARDIAVERKNLNSLVVIKALNVVLQGTPDDELERTLVENFQNEAVALDRIRHQNVVSRLGHGTAIDLSRTTFHYIVLEYLSGGDLAALSRNQPLSLKVALNYLKQVCAGLAHAHECRVIHRDIKPQNLILTADHQTVKITDFGVAKIEATDGAITRVGTNIYAAPEHNPLLHTGQLDNVTATLSEVHLTPAADIYSLAKTAYALLVGEPPRRFAHRQITELPAGASETLAVDAILEVLKKATRAHPSDRYQSVREFWDELEDAALPPTQLLIAPIEKVVPSEKVAPTAKVAPSENGAGLQPSANRADSADFTAQAPPRARFDSTRALLQMDPVASTATHPRIVVQVGNGAVAKSTPDVSGQRKAQAILNSLPDTAAPLSPTKTQPPPKRALAGRGARFVVAMALIIAFAGMLLATHNYFRGRVKLPWSTGTTNPPAVSSAPTDVGREAVTSTDVYLRPDPGTSNRPIGMAEYGSRVRILSVDNNWYEVQILEHGRERQDETLNAERGWVNRKYLNLNS